MLRNFQNFFSFGKAKTVLFTKHLLIGLVIFLILALHGWYVWQNWQRQKQNNAWQAEVRVKLDQLQSNSNYSSSLLWTLKNQIDQLPYQINKK